MATSKYILLFALQTFAQLSVAFLFGFLIRKAFLALGAFLFYFLVFENILTGLSRYYESNAAHYLPLEISDRIIPQPAFIGEKLDLERYNRSIAEIPQFALLTVFLTGLIWLICYRINNKRDLK